jgi:hypothetical protein
MPMGIPCDVCASFVLLRSTLAGNPGFATVAVLTLALGIGANTAIFTLMDQVLFRLMPVHEPERLVLLDGPGPFSGSTHSHSSTVTEVSHPLFLELRDKVDGFAGMLAQYATPVHLTEAAWWRFATSEVGCPFRGGLHERRPPGRGLRLDGFARRAPGG